MAAPIVASAPVTDPRASQNGSTPLCFAVDVVIPRAQVSTMAGYSAAAAAERVTGTPFLAAETWRSPSPPAAVETQQVEEAWTEKSELLLYTWSSAWDQKAAAHGAAEGRARCRHLALQVPTVLIPIALAPLLAAQYVQENSIIVVLALIVSGLTGALQSVLGLERKSEQHAQAAFRYADLLTDVEELLCKDRRFRPRCDVTVQKFKMRMDSAERYSPPVSVPPPPDSSSEEAAESP